MDTAWSQSVESLFSQLKSHPQTGLSEGESKERLKSKGPNTLPQKERVSFWRLLFSQFSSFIIWLLIGAAIVAGFIGDAIDAWAIIAIVIFNAILGFIQEFRAERSLEALQKLALPSSKVIREGVLRTLPSEEIVPGDLLVLEAGDRIPADGRIVDLAQLSIDEASLTGESFPVQKSLSVLNQKCSLSDRVNMVFRGTTVVSGKGHVLVTKTGIDTEMGKIAQGLLEEGKERTPLQLKLDKLGKRLVYLCLAIVAVVFVLGLFRGLNWMEMLLVALSLAVAAIPEGLPAVVTISLSIGVRKMAEKNALVRRLSSVETLGSTTVICTDKTGTLTESAMAVKQVFVDGKLIDVTGSGYEPSGMFSSTSPSLEKALSIGILCNNANLVKEDGKWACVGDPTECALLTVGAKMELSKEALQREFPYIEEIPFDSDRKMMSVKRGSKENPCFYVKGAPNVLLDRATKMLHEGREVPLDRALFEREAADLASHAYRVLGVAYQTDFSRKEKENLVFVGLLAMMDPPRPEVKEAIAECKRAGIQTLMVTGDHKATAEAIAKQLDMDVKGSIAGAELDSLTDEELQNLTLFSRISASHKLRIIKALQSRGHVVAMTGDGVNDAPAIKAADIGIAMGITGTDVTKESSDMIILDDNFTSIVRAVKLGRGIYDNIVKFVSYLLSSNIAEILVIFIAMVLGFTGSDGRTFVPLLPVQLLWMNLVTDGFPAISLALDPIDPRVMSRPPRPKNEEILNRRFSLFIFSISLLVTAGALTACFWGLRQSTQLAQTMTFTTLIVLELVRAQMIRHQYRLTLFSNPYLIAALASSLILQLIVVYVPPLEVIFGTVPLRIEDWGVIGGIAFLLWWAGLFLTKRFYKE